MRRAASALIMGVSLLVATATWAGFVLTRTILDPGRSERLADRLLDDEEIRAVMVDRLADSLQAGIPDEVPVPRETLEQAADLALEDPRVETLIRDGIVQVHQNALNGVDEPVTLDASALGAAGRDAAVQVRPELDAVLPAATALSVELPSAGLSWLGTVRQQVIRFTGIGAVISIIGIATAFVLSRNRPKTLRRVAYWAFVASAFWLAAAYALPWLLERIAPSTVSIAMAAIDVFFGAMVTPALIMAGVGVALVLLSMVWPAVGRRRPAAQLGRSQGPVPAQAMAGAGRGTPPGWRPESGPPARPYDHRPQEHRPHDPGYGAGGYAPAAYRAGAPEPRSYEPTASYPVIVSRFDADEPPPSPHSPPSPPPFPPSPAAPYHGADRPTERVDPDSTMLAGPRWEPGVGYVDDAKRDVFDPEQTLEHDRGPGFEGDDRTIRARPDRPDGGGGSQW